MAQLASVLGREFSYELIQAVSALDDDVLQRDLGQLVDTELPYERGAPPHARYIFKHALIRDAAYAALLKSARERYHRQVAEVLKERVEDTAESPPEVIA